MYTFYDPKSQEVISYEDYELACAQAKLAGCDYLAVFPDSCEEPYIVELTDGKDGNDEA